MSGAMHRLRYQWSRRLQTLQQDPSSPMSTSDCWYARNCHPFGFQRVLPDRLPQSCKRPLCPHCWARRVVINVWARVFPRLLSAESIPGVVVYRKLVTLASFRTRWVFPFETTPEALRRSIESHRNWLSKEVENEGGMTLFTLEPRKSKEFVVTRRSLLVVPKEGSEALVEQFAESQVKFPASLCLPALRSLVATATEYPILLMREPAADVAQVLRALRGFRRLSFHGRLRRSHSC